jgi:hypothetical protein
MPIEIGLFLEFLAGADVGSSLAALKAWMLASLFFYLYG